MAQILLHHLLVSVEKIARAFRLRTGRMMTSSKTTSSTILKHYLLNIIRTINSFNHHNVRPKITQAACQL
jgi:hypothetical protein